MRPLPVGLLPLHVKARVPSPSSHHLRQRALSSLSCLCDKYKGEVKGMNSRGVDWVHVWLLPHPRQPVRLYLGFLHALHFRVYLPALGVSWIPRQSRAVRPQHRPRVVSKQRAMLLCVPEGVEVQRSCFEQLA